MMTTSYVIKWKSTVNGRAGKGTRHFDKEDAEQLAQELNHEYPQIHHEAVPVQPEPELEVAPITPGLVHAA